MTEQQHKKERVFFASNVLSPDKTGWYVELNVGKNQGPFKTQKEATALLESFVKIHGAREESDGLNDE